MADAAPHPLPLPRIQPKDHALAFIDNSSCNLWLRFRALTVSTQRVAGLDMMRVAVGRCLSSQSAMRAAVFEHPVSALGMHRFRLSPLIPLLHVAKVLGPALYHYPSLSVPKQWQARYAERYHAQPI